MGNEPARLTGISLCSTEISARRADFFPYETSSPANRAEMVHTAHVLSEIFKTKMAAVKATTASSEKQEKRKNFRWTDEMIENLVLCISNFKTAMTFKGLDFDGDKPYLYSEIRKSMAEIYTEDPALFGGLDLRTFKVDEIKTDSQEEITQKKVEIKQHNALISKGKNRVQEKMKEIRQSFSKALINGTRSGSGKIIYQHFDALKLIWSGAANVEPLEFGVDTDTTENLTGEETPFINDNNNTSTTSNSNSSLDEQLEEDELSMKENLQGGSNITKDHERQTARSKGKSTITNIEDELLSTVEDQDSMKEITGSKRKSAVPKLVDNKRKHLEKSLSAAQRDKIFLDEAKEDALFRKDIAKAMEESNKTFSASVEKLSTSITTMADGISKSIEKLAQAMCFQAPTTMQPVNQNMFYQNIPSALQSQPQQQGFYSRMMQNDENSQSFSNVTNKF